VSGYLGDYAVVGLLVLLGALFVIVARGATRLLAPFAPHDGKLATYECGLDPVDTDWAQTQVRYYVFAYLYVVFAVDAVYLFPWATVFAAPSFGSVTAVEMAVFLAFLAVGIVYAWRRDVLGWDRVGRRTSAGAAA